MVRRLHHSAGSVSARLLRQLPVEARQLKDPHAPTSGLGDRIGVMIQLSLARSLNCKVVTCWDGATSSLDRAAKAALPNDIREYMSFSDDPVFKPDLASVLISEGHVLPSMRLLCANGVSWHHGFSLVPDIQHAGHAMALVSGPTGVPPDGLFERSDHAKC